MAVDTYTQQGVFTNAVRKLHLVEDATETEVPLITFDEQPETKDSRWFNSADVDENGVPWENGQVLAQAMGYRCETKMFHANEVSPSLLTVLQAIRACKHTVGTAANLLFKITEPDGTAEYCYCDVKNVTTVKGNTEVEAALGFELRRTGRPFTNESGV